MLNLTFSDIKVTICQIFFLQVHQRTQEDEALGDQYQCVCPIAHHWLHHGSQTHRSPVGLSDRRHLPALPYSLCHFLDNHHLIVGLSTRDTLCVKYIGTSSKFKTK